MHEITKIILNPFYINIFLLFIYAHYFLNNRKIKNGKLYFITFSTINWILISSLRDVSVGGRDVYISYNNSFYNSSSISWKTAALNLLNVFNFKSEVKDPGYLIIEKISRILTDNYQIYLLIVSLAFMIPFARFIYRNSKGPLTSFLIYSTLFYSFFSLTGFRQTIATSLIVIIGYEYIKEKNFKKFALLSIISFSIHKSSIAFIPFYFVVNSKILKKYSSYVLIFFLLIILTFKDYILNLIIIFGYGDYLNNEIGGTQTFVMLMVIVSLVTLWRSKNILKKNIRAKDYIQAVYIGTFFSVVSLFNQSFMRIQQYYSLFLVLLIPEIVKSFESKERNFVFYAAISILLLLFFRSNLYYKFFWEVL